MLELEFEGVIYILTPRGWAQNGEIVHQQLQQRLFAKWEELNPIETLRVTNIMEMADYLKNAGLYNTAVRYYKAAVVHEDARTDYIRNILPSLSSCYRKLKLPQESILLYGRYNQPEYISVAFLTSIGAAYLDLGHVTLARQFANRAFALNGGNADLELRALYAHIHAMEQ